MKNVELARQNYAVVYNRYKNGVALIADMLDASVAKLSAEQQLVNAASILFFITINFFNFGNPLKIMS